MSYREEFAAAVKAAIGPTTVRSLASRAGWGRSTIQDWLRGVRVPSEDRLKDLLVAANVDEDAWGALFDLRDAAARESGAASNFTTAPVDLPLAEVATSVTSVTSAGAQEADTDQPGSHPPHGLFGGHRRLLVGTIAVVCGAVLFGSGYLLGRGSHRDQSTTDRPTPVEARVANTEGLGVYTYQGPSNKTAKVSSLTDGDIVSVTCVVVSVPVTDDAMKLTRSVWALLSTGSWIPDLYLDLDRSWAPPQQPPPPLHSC